MRSEKLEYLGNKDHLLKPGWKHAYSNSSTGVLIRACAIMFFVLQQVITISLLDTGLLLLWVLFTLTTQSLIVCFTLKCCMAAVVNKIKATECGVCQYLPKFEIFSFLPYWGTLHTSAFFYCWTREICSENVVLFIISGPKVNVHCKATCYSLHFLLVWAIFAFPCHLG